jgi:hypothetical protein
LEKESLLNSAKKNYENMLEEALNSKSRENVIRSGIKLALEEESHQIRDFVLYPEMLSPDITLQLVKCIASRSYSFDDFKTMFEASQAL